MHNFVLLIRPCASKIGEYTGWVPPMNPVTASNEFMRQWLDLVGMATRASVELYAETSRQALSMWGFQQPAASQMSSWPFMWPYQAFGHMGPAVHPMQFSNPWLSMAMPQSAWTTAAWPAATFGSFTSWPWLGGQHFGAYNWLNPFAAMQRSPAEEFVEQAVSTYRSASGYAVAAILAPLASMTARPTWH
jgi:hypothetical protein